MSYLGFRFDGKQVFLRDNTLANLRGKIVRTCKSEAFYHVKRHKEKDLDWLLNRAPTDKILKMYWRAENYDEAVNKARENGNEIFKEMTFLSYAKRAIKIFGKQGNPINHQLKKIREEIKTTLISEIGSKYVYIRMSGRE